MMNLKRFARASLLGGAVLIFASAVSAQSQEVTDSHLQAAREAITSINASDIFDTILPESAQALQESLIANNPDLEGLINDVVTEEAIAMAARRADLENEIARIYALAIREEDLRAIAQFYNTDAGRVLLKNGPIATREASRAALVWRAGIERDLRATVSSKIAEQNPRANLDVEPASEQ